MAAKITTNIEDRAFNFLSQITDNRTIEDWDVTVGNGLDEEV
jgi:hypothetical protein